MENTHNLSAPTDRRRRAVRSLTRKIVSYIVVCAFLAFVNWFTTPDRWWVVWVIAGWGLGIVLSLLYYLLDCDDENKDC